jgi:hypothetical protein
LCLGDALGECVPIHHGLDRSERVFARLLGFQQSLTDAAIQFQLVVDGLAGCLELLLVLAPGRVELCASILPSAAAVNCRI